MKVLIMYFFPISRYFLPPRSKYWPRHRVLKCPQPMLFP